MTSMAAQSTGNTTGQAGLPLGRETQICLDETASNPLTWAMASSTVSLPVTGKR